MAADWREVRQRMAEQGHELTPGVVRWALKKLRKLQRSLRNNPNLLTALSVYERQELRRELAEIGKEVTLEEVGELLEVLERLRDAKDI